MVVHTAAVARNFLSDEAIRTISWPPYSPDLNPIGTLWSAMKIYIYNKYGDSQIGR